MQQDNLLPTADSIQVTDDGELLAQDCSDAEKSEQVVIGERDDQQELRLDDEEEDADEDDDDDSDGGSDRKTPEREIEQNFDDNDKEEKKEDENDDEDVESAAQRMDAF